MAHHAPLRAFVASWFKCFALNIAVAAHERFAPASPPDRLPGSFLPQTTGSRKGSFVSQQSVRAVVSVLGKDQKGVVAQFATYMAERGINIDDMEQRVVRGFFVMDMLVDLKDLTTDLSELITGLLDLGKKIDMEVKVHLHSERRKKRVAVLVSKEPHCLQTLIEDRDHGKLHGEVAVILANHPD